MVHNPNEDTEFNDALRAHGIIPPKPATPPSPSANLPSADELFHSALATSSAAHLGELEEDADNSEDERMFATYRANRLKEMKELETKKRSVGAGDGLREISRDDFVKEVSEGSKKEIAGEENEGKGSGVVCFLYKDSIPLSNHLRNLLTTLSPHLPLTRFVSIRGDQCIPNYPDKNIPTLLLYRAGECLGSVVGLRKGMNTGVEDVQGILLQHGIIDAPSSTLGAFLLQQKKDREDYNDDSDEGGGDDGLDFGGMRKGKSIRDTKTRGKDADEGGDSDFDM